MYEVRVYDKDMKLKKTIPEDVLSDRYWDMFNLTHLTTAPFRTKHKARLEKEFREKYEIIEAGTKRFTAHPEMPEEKEGPGSQGGAEGIKKITTSKELP
tara:strand:+ start:925 stop:1221 length:297 start_codon:yes stop_codon:yes gene_type:complete